MAKTAAAPTANAGSVLDRGKTGAARADAARHRERHRMPRVERAGQRNRRHRQRRRHPGRPPRHRGSTARGRPPSGRR
ncbi:MAG: hypothetical protein U0232_02825 [Thermomicrobiales bacterium]